MKVMWFVMLSLCVNVVSCVSFGLCVGLGVVWLLLIMYRWVGCCGLCGMCVSVLIMVLMFLCGMRCFSCSMMNVFCG